MKRSSFIILLLVAASATAQTRRLAIVVGNNAGGPDMPPLRYAEMDAGKLARVLDELGDVDESDLFLLQGRGVDDVERAFQLARKRIEGAKQQTVLLFYFSGHSDGESLHIGRETLSYASLRALLEGAGADVRVAIVDACKSGQGLRERGGRPAEGFTIRLSDALKARGEVFISSSSEEEPARESNEVMGGVFTHHFVSGLRGAADINADKQVTLGEAYRYAYDRTLCATELLTGEGQHATFDYRLSGRGELTLTTLITPPALLEVPEGAQRVMVRDLVRDQVVAEVLGGAGPRELAFAPGRYAISVIKDGQTRGARFTLPAKAEWRPQWSELTARSGKVELAAGRR